MFAFRTNWSLTPNRLSKLIAERRRQGLPILDLTESNPTRCGFAYEGDQILAALTDRRALTYEPDPRGSLSARVGVTDYYAERGVKLSPEQIFLTTSTSEAYSYVFRLLANPGDAILVPRPSYPLFDFLGGLNDLELIPYPLEYDEGWRIDLASLRASLDACERTARAVIVVHPNNPTGSFVHADELEFLLRLCTERALALIADEVFADYAFASNERRVLSHAAASEALTFTLSGISKISGLPQMKLAWVVVNGPAELREKALARLEVIADTYLSVSAPLAFALPKFLEMHRRLQPQILKRVRGNLARLDALLCSASSVSRLKTEGGWYAILKVPDKQSDEDWAIEFLSQDGVLVHPGHFFDFASEGYLVISLLPQPEVFAPGIRKLLARVSGS